MPELWPEKLLNRRYLKMPLPNPDKLEDMLVRHEGLRLKPYYDSLHNLTIGVGRNLFSVGITSAEAFSMLDTDIKIATEELQRHLPWFHALDEVRQAALIDMCFNMGWTRLAKFTNTLAAMADAQWQTAAKEITNSLWFHQVGQRAQELAAMIQTGEWQ